jgi:transposase
VTRYIAGDNRQQSTLFPQSLDEYIAEDNPVRVVDVFVDELDLSVLGFNRATPADTGRPSYHPSTLLKIYIYGYLNRIQTSRRLERETQRNIELIWLTGRLSPDFKTIADFRKDNGKAIQKVCGRFVEICKQIGVFEQSNLVVDGSKFKAVNSRDNNYTESKLKARISQTEKRVARYLDALDRADRQPETVPEARVTHLIKRLEDAKELLKRFSDIEEQLKQTPDKQISLTDPDARSIATSGKGTAIVGYNVQVVVDDQHHIIVSHEVTNKGHDRDQLGSMSKKAKEATGIDQPTVYADRGYYSNQEMLECEQNNIVPMVPKPITSNSKADGRFEKQDFKYIPDTDEYECPAGERAPYRCDSKDKDLKIRMYWPSNSICAGCEIKAQCTTGKHRRIRRWEHEDVLDRMQHRLDSQPEASRIRRQTVEHPFGTLKSWMGSTHFVMKTMIKVGTEMSLHVLAYNIKRMIAIHGVQKLVGKMTV